MKFPLNNIENLIEVKNMGNPYWITWKIDNLLEKVQNSDWITWKIDNEMEKKINVLIE